MLVIVRTGEGLWALETMLIEGIRRMKTSIAEAASRPIPRKEVLREKEDRAPSDIGIGAISRVQPVGQPTQTWNSNVFLTVPSFSRLQKMPFCPRCGTEAREVDAFCKSCGTRLTQASNSVPSENRLVTTPSNLASASPMLSCKAMVMRKRQFTTENRYDFEDASGLKIGEAYGTYQGAALTHQFLEVEVSDSNKRRLMLLKETVSSNPLGLNEAFRHEFRFLDSESRQIGVIRKVALNIGGDEYRIERNETDSIRVSGDRKGRRYSMTNSSSQEKVFASIERVPSLTKPYYNIAVSGDVDPRLVVGTTIVIQHVKSLEAGAGARFTTGRT